MTPRVVVHVPHSSAHIPADISFLLDAEQLGDELLRMTDHYTDELFALPPNRATAVVYPVSRLVVDPERFPDDTQEPMALKGMGAVYTRTADGRPLRSEPSADERRRLMSRFYEPHHALLAAAANAALGAHGTCIVIDAHSFPSRPLPYEDDQNLDRPDICIGVDSVHTPAALCDAAVRAFEAQGWRVAVNRPFSGALVPLPFYGRDTHVEGLMVEVKRGLYMDEATGVRLPWLPDIKRRIGRALAAFAGFDPG